MQQKEYDVFISYSTKYKEWVSILYANLKAHGKKVFLDSERLTSGNLLGYDLEKNLRLSKNAILVVTPEIEKSDWIKHEMKIMQALQKESINNDDNSFFVHPVLFDNNSDYFQKYIFLKERLVVYFTESRKYKSNFNRLFNNLEGIQPDVKRDYEFEGFLIEPRESSYPWNVYPYEKITNYLHTEELADLAFCIAIMTRTKDLLINLEREYAELLNTRLNQTYHSKIKSIKRSSIVLLFFLHQQYFMRKDIKPVDGIDYKIIRGRMKQMHHKEGDMHLFFCKVIKERYNYECEIERIQEEDSIAEIDADDISSLALWDMKIFLDISKDKKYRYDNATEVKKGLKSKKLDNEAVKRWLFFYRLQKRKIHQHLKIPEIKERQKELKSKYSQLKEESNILFGFFVLVIIIALIAFLFSDYGIHITLFLGLVSLIKTTSLYVDIYSSIEKRITNHAKLKELLSEYRKIKESMPLPYTRREMDGYLDKIIADKKYEKLTYMTYLSKNDAIHLEKIGDLKVVHIKSFGFFQSLEVNDKLNSWKTGIEVIPENIRDKMLTWRKGANKPALFRISYIQYLYFTEKNIMSYSFFHDLVTAVDFCSSAEIIPYSHVSNYTIQPKIVSDRKLKKLPECVQPFFSDVELHTFHLRASSGTKVETAVADDGLEDSFQKWYELYRGYDAEYYPYFNKEKDKEEDKKQSQQEDMVLNEIPTVKKVITEITERINNSNTKKENETTGII